MTLKNKSALLYISNVLCYDCLILGASLYRCCHPCFIFVFIGRPRRYWSGGIQETKEASAGNKSWYPSQIIGIDKFTRFWCDMKIVWYGDRYTRKRNVLGSVIQERGKGGRLLLLKKEKKHKGSQPQKFA